MQRSSGNEAISAADERAASTREVNIGSTPPLPIAEDTANVRMGPEINDQLLALLPLIGVWRGGGRFGNEPYHPDTDQPHFGQQIAFSHDGRPFVVYESLTWRYDDSGTLTEASERETGFLQVLEGGEIQFSHTSSDGIMTLSYGKPVTLTSYQFALDALLRAPGAVRLTAASRLYGITPAGQLAYVDERAIDSDELVPYASAILDRIAG